MAAECLPGEALNPDRTQGKGPNPAGTTSKVNLTFSNPGNSFPPSYPDGDHPEAGPVQVRRLRPLHHGHGRQPRRRRPPRQAGMGPSLVSPQLNGTPLATCKAAWFIWFGNFEGVLKY